MRLSKTCFRTSHCVQTRPKDHLLEMLYKRTQDDLFCSVSLGEFFFIEIPVKRIKQEVSYT